MSRDCRYSELLYYSFRLFCHVIVELSAAVSLELLTFDFGAKHLCQHKMELSLQGSCEMRVSII